MISTRAHQAEEALTSGPCPESHSQGMRDPLSHFKSSREGLASWSQRHRKGTRSTSEVTRLAQGNRGDHSWCRWLRGPSVGHWVGGEEGQLLTLPWASCGSEPLVHPSWPSFFLLPLPLLFSKSFDQGLTQLCMGAYAPVAWVSLEPFGYCIVYKCNSPEFQTHRPTVWPGLCFCKDQSCILGLFIKNPNL